MPAIQTTYSERQRVAFAGMIANSEENNEVTRLVEDAGGIGFGKACYRGTADNQVTATPSAKFVGISVRNLTLEAVDADKYVQKANIPLMNRGVIWVTAGVNVADGDPVYVTPAGVFTNVDGTGANFLIADAEYDTTASAAALAKVRLK